MSNLDWGAIPKSLATNVSQVLNKKFGVSTGFKPVEWAEQVNLMGPLPEKTASGAVASFSDGADDVPVKSCKVTFTPSGGGGTPSSPVPITGYTGLTLTRAGKNLLDITDVYDEGYYNTSGTWSASSSYNCYSISCKPNTTYTVSGNFAGIQTCWKADGTFISGVNQGSGFSKTFTTPADCYIMRRSILKTNIDGTQMVEVGSSATTYAPYSAPTVYTDTFGQTVYGGERDLTTDEVEATYCAPVTFTGASDENWYYSVSGTKQRVFISLPNSPVKNTTNTLAGNYIKQASDAIGYPNEYEAWINVNGNIVIGVPSTITSASDWKTFLADNNLQVSYIVENPTEITGLTSHEISTMLGDNNFYADVGNTSVEYRADIDLVLNASSATNTSTRSLQTSAAPEVEEGVVDEVEEGVDDMR